jgi:hypothetical protein
LKLAGGTVVLRMEDNSEIEMKLSALAAQDQQWILSAVKQREFLAKQSRLMQQTVNVLKQGKAKPQLDACIRLREFGVLAAQYTDAVQGFINSAENDQARMQGLATLIVIRPKDDQQWTASLEYVLDKSPEQLSLFYQAAPLYFSALASFGDKSVPYLRYAAYTGKIETTNDLITKTKSVVALNTVSYVANQVRASAVSALGLIDVSGPSGQALLTQIHEILYRCGTSAEKKLNGAADETTIQACMIAYGNLGYPNANLTGFLARHKKNYPNLESTAQAKITAKTKERTELAKLARAAKLRTFVAATGKEQIVAEFISLEGENVRLRDAKNQTLVFDLSKFSADDQAWIKAKAGVK